MVFFCSHLKALNRAFHPLGNSNQKNPEFIAHDVIEASVSILRLVESISKRLLGSYTQVRDDEMTPMPMVAKLSAAQLAAQEVLRFMKQLVSRKFKLFLVNSLSGANHSSS